MTSFHFHAIGIPSATLVLLACQTAPNSTEPPTPQQNPSRTTPTKLPSTAPSHEKHNLSPAPTPPTTPPLTSKTPFLQPISANYAELENAFALGDCPRVLDHWSKLGVPETASRFAELPRLSAAAIAICNAQKSPLDTNKNRLAIEVLSELEQLPSPLFNKAWIAKTLASFHVALGEFSLATTAIQREQKYLQEQGAQQASQQTPSAVTGATTATTPAVAGSENPLDPEKKFNDAKAALNTGDPAAAVTLLDSVPEPERTEKIRRLRRDAVEAHVKDLRTRARQQYMRAQGTQNKGTKVEALQQCLSINEEILAKYPDTPSKPGIERSINSIKSEIAFLNKGV
jgi:hypothetical protein